MKARYLAQAYRIAIEEMPLKTWNDCCHEAINIGQYDHDRKLKVGDVQYKIFCPCDEGPYWMTPEEQEQIRKDCYGTTMIQKDYTKPQLIEMLEQKGIVNAKGNKQQIIKDMAQRAGIPLLYAQREIIQGWGKNQRGWNRFFGSEGGLTRARIAKFTRSTVPRIQRMLFGRTRVFGISCPTSRTLRHKRQCFNSKPWRWGY
jgi:hypothetical protein